MSRWILISLGIFTIALPSVIQAGIVSFSYGSSGSLISQQATAAGIPVISSQPISIPVAAPGFVAGFSVNIVSASPVSYQWYFNGVLIPGATGDSLLFTNPTPVQEGSYTVTVTNSSGSVTSAAAILAIDSNGNELPDSWEMTYFGNLDQKGFDDFSGDGITNLNKYLNGLDPTQKTPWTWIASNGDFNTPENWDYQRDRSPKVGDVCIVNTGTFSTSSQITASQVTVGVSFTTPSSADFLLNVTGSWTFNGAFTLSSGRMFTVTGGGSVSVAGNTTLNNASIYVYGTSTKLSFPNLTSYTQPLNKSSTWIAGYLFDDNTGCELNFPALQTITGSVVTAQFLDATLTAEAKYGAVINFPTLTSISVPVGTSADNSTDGVRLYAHDAGIIQAASLASFTDNSSSPASSLDFNSTSNITSLNTVIGVAFTLNKGTLVSPLADITGLTSIYVHGTDTKLSFPNVTSYTQPANKLVTWTAGGSSYQDTTGCELNFPALQTITGSVVTAQFLDATLTAEAKYGAVINFPTLTSISVPVGTSADNSTDGVRLYAHDAGAIQAAFLTSFTDDSSSPASSLNFNSLSNLSSLNTISGVALTLNAGAMVNPLADITGLTSIYVHGTGTKLSFPNVTSYTQPANTPVTWAAGSPSYGYEDNTGCELNFPALQSITGSVVTIFIFRLNGIFTATLTAEAQNGAVINFPALTSITVPTGGTSGFFSTDGVKLYAHDAGAIQATMLASFTDNSNSPTSSLDFNNLSNLSSLNAFAGVAFTLNAGAVVSPLTDITGLTSIYVHGTGTKLSFPNLTSYTQPANTPVTWTAGSPSYGYEDNTGCELNFPALQSITGSVVTTQYLDATLTAEAQNGATLSFPALTSIAVPVGTSADYGTNGVSLFATDSGRLYAAKLTDFEDLSTPSFSRIEASANSTYRFASLRQAGLQGVTLNGVTLLTGPVNLQPPVITSPGSIVSLRGQALSYTITANNQPFTLTATPLPGGLSVNTSTGHLSGTPAAIGIYLITLSAENPDGISTLPLTLTVIPASFDDFLDQAGVPINKRGQLDDPDNDGIPNLLEFALGQPPMTSTTRAAQRLMLSQTTISFIYPHSRPDVSYSVETTDNLSDPFSWTTSGVTQGTVDTYGYVTATISATGQRRFVRLKVTLIP